MVVVVDTQPIGTKEVAGDDDQLTVLRSATDGFAQRALQHRLIRKSVECQGVAPMVVAPMLLLLRQASGSG